MLTEFVVKLQKTKGKEKILKTISEKKQVTHRLKMSKRGSQPKKLEKEQSNFYCKMNKV